MLKFQFGSLQPEKGSKLKCVHQRLRKYKYNGATLTCSEVQPTQKTPLLLQLKAYMWVVGKVTSFIFLGHTPWSFFRRKNPTTIRNWKNQSTSGWIPLNYSTHPPLPITIKIIHDAENLWPAHTFWAKNTIYMTYLQCSLTIQHRQWVHLYHKHSIYNLQSTFS